MRSSALPTLALAILMLAAGSFGTWYFLSQQEPSPRAPIAAEKDPAKAEAPAPTADPTTDKPLVRSPYETPAAPAKETPLAPKAGPTTPTAKPEGGKVEATPGSTPEHQPTPEELADLARKLQDKLGEGRIALPGAQGEGKALQDILNGPKVEFVANISGTVTDAGGSPVAGARIHGSFSEEISSSGDGRQVRMALAIGDGGMNKGAPLATTGADGSFSAEIRRQVAEGANLGIRLTAAADDFGDSKSERVVLKNGDTKDGIKLALRGAGSVAGKVVDGTGRGVQGVKVTLGSGEGGFVIMDGGDMPEMGGSGQSGTSDVDGTFTIKGVPEGRYKPRLRATGWRQISGPTEVTVKAGTENRFPADFVVAAAAGLKARLVDAQGAPIHSFASVEFKEGDKVVKRMNANLGADGALALNDVPLGALVVVIKLYGFGPVTTNTTLADGQVTDLGSLTAEKTPGGEGEDDGIDIIMPGD